MRYSKGPLKKNKPAPVQTPPAQTISGNLFDVIAVVKKDLGEPSDLIVTITNPRNNKNLRFATLYFDNLVDKNRISSLSIETAQALNMVNACNDTAPDCYFTALTSTLSGFRDTRTGSDYTMLTRELVDGNTVFLLDGCERFLSIRTFTPEGRSVDEPTSQNVIRGPKESFTENTGTNIALIRKRIRNKSLRVEDLSLGSVTQTKITLMHIEGIAKNEILQEIKRRLSGIKIDGILDSGYIEELIKDDRYSVFPTFLISEKPDSVCAALLEGRVAILTDGTSYVLTAPALFFEFFQESEDYYSHFILSSFIRIIRILSLVLTLLVPATYIALTTFHQEMIPTPLLVSIAAQREGVPFPALVEALLMEIIFEILREAGIRMPRVIGPTISIVGALVLGQAAVEAGFISAVMVIIVSITAIASFAIPKYSLSNSIRMMRFLFMFLSGLFGFFGIFMGLIALFVHLCKLKSIGIPYMMPVAPHTKNALNDTILRFPLWKNKHRITVISQAGPPRVDAKTPVNAEQKGKQEF